MAGISLASGFGRTSANPLDLFATVADTTARNAIPTGVRYEGMTVFVIADQVNYQLIGGITDSEWQESGSGGAGGMVPRWYADADAPLPNISQGVPVWAFDRGQAQKLFAVIKVPNTYKGGKQIFMRTLFASAELGTTNVLFRTTTTLIRPLTDLITSTTNQRTATNTAKVQAPSLTGKFQPIVHDLSDSAGRINGESINPGDSILITLYRDTDTSDAVATIYPDTSEITFG